MKHYILIILIKLHNNKIIILSKAQMNKLTKSIIIYLKQFLVSLFGRVSHLLRISINMGCEIYCIIFSLMAKNIYKS